MNYAQTQIFWPNFTNLILRKTRCNFVTIMLAMSCYVPTSAVKQQRCDTDNLSEVS